MDLKNFLKDKSLNEWINDKYLDFNNLEELRKLFLENKPFSYLELKDFFNENKIIKILKSLSKEEFHERESDLFKFMQTEDFKLIKNKTLNDFRNFLFSNAFISFMEYLTGFELKNKIDISGSLYQNSDYLLCHDDQLEGRKIAYFLYLSNMEENEGGNLNLFNAEFKVARKIIPKFNTFAFFEVSDKSLHELEEVIVNKQRIAISGWFY